MKRNPFEEGIMLDDLFGAMIDDFAENAPAAVKQEMLEEYGRTAEVGQFLASPGVEVNLKAKLIEVAGKLAIEEQVSSSLKSEHDKFVKAVLNQTDEVRKAFQSKNRKIEDLEGDNRSLENANRELCRKFNAIQGGLLNVDSRIASAIADIKGSPEMKAEHLIEFLEKLRDRVSEAEIERDYPSNGFVDPPKSRYERRMEEKAAAEKAAKPEGSDSTGDVISTEANSAPAKKSTARKSRKPKAAKAASAKA